MTAPKGMTAHGVAAAACPRPHQCDSPGKVCFASPKAADRGRKSIRFGKRDGGRPIHTYRCPCGCWHVGHRSELGAWTRRTLARTRAQRKDDR